VFRISQVRDRIPLNRNLADPAAGREIPAEVAARTDEQNNFPPEMWKKMGEAGYFSTPHVTDHTFFPNS
jgi:alkylation response protein AidB-like acyl-CoA dehydrogenase